MNKTRFIHVADSRLLLVSAKKIATLAVAAAGLQRFSRRSTRTSSSNQAVAYSDRAAFIAAAPSSLRSLDVSGLSPAWPGATFAF